MHLLIQRVAQASVQIDGQIHGSIGPGLLPFICADPADTTETVYKAVAKLLKLRIFADEAGRMNRSVQDVGGGLLIVSQFTLAADTRQGNRPSFIGAAPPAQGEALYDAFVTEARRPIRGQHAGRARQRRPGHDPDAAVTHDGFPQTVRPRSGCACHRRLSCVAVAKAGDACPTPDMKRRHP